MLNRRLDLSNKLIHFTKGINDTDDQGAYENLKSIVRNKWIIANNGNIRGAYNCVCFTEAPIDCLKESNGIVCFDGKKRYSNYGIMVSKNDIFNLGGRPAIYSDHEDFDILPEKLRFRFVIFEPEKEIRGTQDKCNFTWEREWRVLNHVFLNQISKFDIIVPSFSIGERLIQECDSESFRIFNDCRNFQIPFISYEELCKDNCSIHRPDCPEPIYIQSNCLVCMDKSC